ncbi:hypothetical protein CSV79_01290, partial [Sporosarcina sp. P13]
ECTGAEKGRLLRDLARMLRPHRKSRHEERLLRVKALALGARFQRRGGSSAPRGKRAFWSAGERTIF